jgi:hypothetical protein
MPFRAISRRSLELLNQNYRAPGVAPGPMPPAAGDAAAADDPTFAVNDEFIRILPFMRAEPDDQPMRRGFQVRSADPLTEPSFGPLPGGNPWVAGQATPFGQELSLSGAQFKKYELVVRVDDLMPGGAPDHDLLDAECRLAEIGIIRRLSADIFGPNAIDDNAELLSLDFYIAPGGPQDVTYSATAKLMGGLAEILARCVPGGDGLGEGATVLVMSARARWRLLAEMEGRAITPQFAYCPLTRKVQLHYHGTPVVIGRVPEPAGAAPTTAAFALTLSGESAIRMVFTGGDDWGLHRRALPAVVTTDSAGEADGVSRAVSVYGNYMLLVPDNNAVARLSGIPSADPIRVP